MTKQRFRVFDPAFDRNNIYRFQAGKTVSLGPVMIATSAQTLLGQWLDAEAITENNCKSRLGAPLGPDGLLDHLTLQTQEPADYIGLSVSITNAAPRALAIIEIYCKMPAAIRPKAIIVGGWHASELPAEFLAAGANVVVHGEAEPILAQLLTALKNGESLENIPGISYLTAEGEFRRNPITDSRYTYPAKPGHLIMPQDEMDQLPFANFGLVRFAKLKILPHQSIRGCSGKCRFCLVKTPPRWLSAKRSAREIMFNYSRGYRHMFIVNDRAEENPEVFTEFLDLLTTWRKEKRLKRLCLMTQNRLSTAAHPEILQKMWDAGVRTVAIGYESPIPEELGAMAKPLNPKKIIEWSKTWKRFGFFIHMMGIFGYPIPADSPQPLNTKGQVMSAKERAKVFWQTIRLIRPATLQILNLTPIPGTEEWEDLERQGRIFTHLGWEAWDGLHVVFQPDEPMTPKDLSRQILWLHSKFYAFRFLYIFGVLPILAHFINIALLTIAMPFIWLLLLPFKNWQPSLAWQKPSHWFRNAKRRFQGNLIVLLAAKQIAALEKGALQEATTNQ